MRTPARPLHTFQGQGGDVNTVQFLPDGHHFGTGTDGVCCFFDTAWAIPMSPLLLSPIQDVSCLWAIPMPTATSGTPSGRGDNKSRMGEGHCSWVSCLGMASDGSAVCTGSWDTSLKVRAYAGNRKKI